MPRSEHKNTSLKRRIERLKSLGPRAPIIRPYRNYLKASRQYLVAEGTEKYTNCVRLGRPCDLTPIDTNK